MVTATPASPAAPGGKIRDSHAAAPYHHRAPDHHHLVPGHHHHDAAAPPPHHEPRPPRPPATTTTHLDHPTTRPAVRVVEDPVGLIVLIVVLVVAIVLVALLLRSRKKRAIEADWRRAVVPALSDAQLARRRRCSRTMPCPTTRTCGVPWRSRWNGRRPPSSTRAGPHPIPMPPAWPPRRPVRSGGWPSPSRPTGSSIRDASAPTGVQLAQADEARRARNSELSAALSRLSARIGSPPRPLTAPLTPVGERPWRGRPPRVAHGAPAGRLVRL